MKKFIFTILLSCSLAYIACSTGDVDVQSIKSTKLANLNKIQRCCL